MTKPRASAISNKSINIPPENGADKYMKVAGKHSSAPVVKKYSDIITTSYNIPLLVPPTLESDRWNSFEGFFWDGKAIAVFRPTAIMMTTVRRNPVTSIGRRVDELIVVIGERAELAVVVRG